jgi:hypothetical protein
MANCGSQQSQFFVIKYREIKLCSLEEMIDGLIEIGRWHGIELNVEKLR